MYPSKAMEVWENLYEFWERAETLKSKRILIKILASYPVYQKTLL